MKSPLVRNMVISAAVHVFLVATIIITSFLSCRAKRQRREIITFVDLQMMSPEEVTARAPAPQDIPEPLTHKPVQPSKKKAVNVSKKVIKQETSPAKKTLTENDIREMLRMSQPSLRQDAIRDEFARYLADVYTVMYRTWQQPGALSGASGLVTRALIRVQRDGWIVHRRIIQSAGNKLMDISVVTALESVKSLPELPRGCDDYEDITIDFELTETSQ